MKDFATLRRRLAIFVVPCLVLCAAAAVGQTRRDTIGVDEIHPGMRGYGLTVFRGETPERFDVTVIDVLHNFRPDQDLILVRTDHPILDNASTVAGMSGSPIYLDGRLAGAYAYGWTFGKDPVAGVTPIASMLAEMRRPERPLPAPVGSPVPAQPAATARGPRPQTAARLAGLAPYLGQTRRTAFSALEEHAARFAPILSPTGVRLASTPLMLGGFTDDVVRLLSGRVEQLGLMTLQTGGGGRAPRQANAPRPHFVDGGSIGVQLVRGDVMATAIGTVTHVSGNRLVAFGHPMMNAGQIALPTCTSRVLHILASEERSFKIAEAVAPLGSLVNDRQAAIVVDASRVAETVPVTVRIHGVQGLPRTEWHMEVASHRSLTPMLVFAAIANALRAASADQTDVVFTARSRVTIERIGPVEVEDIGYVAEGITDPGALLQMRLFSLLDVAYGNPFEEARVRSVELDLSLRFVHEEVRILDAAVAQNEVDPGATVAVHVTVRGFGGAETTRIIQVPIPVEAAGQQIELAFEPGDTVAIEQPIPRSLEDLVQAARAGYPSTSLVVSTRMPLRGLRMRGHVVRSLPGSALDALQTSNDSDPAQMFQTNDRRVIDFGQVLQGSARIRLDVRSMPRD